MAHRPNIKCTKTRKSISIIYIHSHNAYTYTHITNGSIASSIVKSSKVQQTMPSLPQLPSFLKPSSSREQFYHRYHLNLNVASTFPSYWTVDCRSHHISLPFCIFLIASHLCICARANGPTIQRTNLMLYSLVRMHEKVKKKNPSHHTQSCTNTHGKHFSFPILFYFYILFLLKYFSPASYNHIVATLTPAYQKK